MSKKLTIYISTKTTETLKTLKTLTGKDDSDNIEDALEVWLKRLLQEDEAIKYFDLKRK